MIQLHVPQPKQSKGAQVHVLYTDLTTGPTLYVERWQVLLHGKSREAIQVSDIHGKLSRYRPLWQAPRDSKGCW